MRRMLDIRVKLGSVFELHDATECIALSSGRNVWAYVSLKKAGDLALESSDLCRGFLLQSFRCIRLPAKCEYVKYAAWLVFSRRDLGQLRRSKCRNRGCDAAIPD